MPRFKVKTLLNSTYPIDYHQLEVNHLSVENYSKIECYVGGLVIRGLQKIQLQQEGECLKHNRFYEQNNNSASAARF